MNPRHAAALVLVGWYLILPPVRLSKNEYPYLDDHSPYPDWVKSDLKFKNRDQCEDVRDRLQAFTLNRNVLSFSPGFYRGIDPAPWFAQQTEAECIATDDPRLKEK